jgi:tetratricopeptide (TPR) repeat protein
MSTVSLSMIIKDEFDNVVDIVREALPYFDELNLVVSDAPTKRKLSLQFKDEKKVNLRLRKWNDRFDQARNASMALCTTDYMFWLDADDSFDFSNIPSLVQTAEGNNLGAIFLPYNYMYTESGELGAQHWRERLIDLNKGYEWRGWVHETLISEQSPKSVKIDKPVHHNATFKDMPEKIARNHHILVQAYEATRDPRYLNYLGMSYFSLGEYEKAIEALDAYLAVGMNPDDIYRALSTISESCYKMGAPQKAVEYASKCLTMMPEYPQAYWMMAQYESDQDNHEQALTWARLSEAVPDPDTLAVWDPSARGRAVWIAARSLFMLNRFGEAFEELRRIRKSDEAKQVWEDFLTEASKEKFVNILPSFQQFFDSPGILWRSLTDELKYDVRLRSLRNRATEPKHWNDKSIVIFCGQGFEEWGPHTLDKGMGGSEEAVIYLSRELSRLGYQVTVYNETEAPTFDIAYKDEAVKPRGKETPMEVDYRVEYRPWKEIDTRDFFNVFVSWRQPLYIEKINAKVKLVDVHDVLPETIMKDFPDVTYLVKSDYHRGLTPKLTDDKFRVIGNGIVKEQFNEDHSNPKLQ